LKSPVRENRTPGSVRGASGNRRPYLASKIRVRFGKLCESGGESPSRPGGINRTEFRVKAKNGKV
jgi:hypothetical protein